MYPRGGAFPYAEFPDQPYDPSGVLYNPGQTNPFPNPGPAPVAFWHQPELPLTWVSVVDAVTTTPTGTAWVASWTSPRFDLHPEQRGAGLNYNIATPGNGAQPIWQSAGKILHTFWTLPAPADSATMAQIQITSQESASPDDPARLATITSVQQMSDVYSTGKQAAYQGFIPPGGGGSYIRFWSVTVTFRRPNTAVAPPNITLRGGFY